MYWQSTQPEFHFPLHGHVNRAKKYELNYYDVATSTWNSHCSENMSYSSKSISHLQSLVIFHRLGQVRFRSQWITKLLNFRPFLQITFLKECVLLFPTMWNLNSISVTQQSSKNWERNQIRDPIQLPSLQDSMSKITEHFHCEFPRVRFSCQDHKLTGYKL